ncbi:hypothetical protein HYDPIDRAFT_175942 [Hydnomerulius pinastri MD-312]|uniref:Phosphoglycerate mutase-like protein n=1 Tax=Hydnomerulius pinastri MD-312 TaxID=994086 RepID=A0A0C9VDF6_9AGAM|nr:hypothetical protein HYDPIDRAFT_175942 [Hydnomerulius pinastri MD-312]
MVNARSASSLLGAVLLARHGDRLEFFQDPTTYTPTETYITPLGSQQEFQLGSFLRSTYLTPSSLSYVNGISTQLADINQVFVLADAGGGGSVILNSIGGLLQGLYPATPESTITLANGTTILGPLGGYQYIPVHSVEPSTVPYLNSWTDCPVFDAHTSRFYSSEAFFQKAEEAQPLLDALAPFLGDRDRNFTNMIFDFVNVQLVHNATFYETFLPTLAAQAYGFANYHEYGVFTDSSASGIGSIAAQTILSYILPALQGIVDDSNALKLELIGISYKPFISLFNVTEAVDTHPDIAGIVDYASVVALEVFETGGCNDEPRVRMKFRNGTSTDQFRQLFMFGKTDLSVTDLVDKLSGIVVGTTEKWCQACNQTTARGCSAYQN